MKKQQYTDLIETHDYTLGFNRFEKVLMASQRAKKLYDMDDAAKSILPHKPSYQSLQEINEGKINIQRSNVRVATTTTMDDENE